MINGRWRIILVGPTNTLFPMQSSAIHVSVYLTALATSQSEHQTLNNNKHSKAKQTLIFFSSAHASLGALIAPILIIIIIIISVISRSIYLSVSSSNSYFFFFFSFSRIFKYGLHIWYSLPLRTFSLQVHSIKLLFQWWSLEFKFLFLLEEELTFTYSLPLSLLHFTGTLFFVANLFFLRYSFLLWKLIFFSAFLFLLDKQWFWIIYVCVISSNSEIESKSAGVSGYGGLSSLSRLICLKSYLSVRTSALLQFWNFLLRRIIRSLLIGCFLGSFDMLIESSCH